MNQLLEIVKIYVDAINNKNLQMLDTIFHPEYSLTESTLEKANTYISNIKGRDFSTVRKRAEEIFNNFPDLSINVHETYTSVNKVCIYYTLTGTHKGTYLGVPATNKQIVWEGAQFFTFKDNKIIEINFVFDTLALFQQLGQVIVQENEEQKLKQYFKALKDMGLLPA